MKCCMEVSKSTSNFLIKLLFRCIFWKFKYRDYAQIKIHHRYRSRSFTKLGVSSKDFCIITHSPTPVSSLTQRHSTPISRQYETCVFLETFCFQIKIYAYNGYFIDLITRMGGGRMYPTHDKNTSSEFSD